MDAREDSGPSPAGGRRLPAGEASDSEEEEEFFDALASDEDAAPAREGGSHTGQTETEARSAVGEEELSRPMAAGLGGPSPSNQTDKRTVALRDDSNSSDEDSSSGSKSEENTTERQTVGGGVDVHKVTLTSREASEKDEPHEGLEAEAAEEEREAQEAGTEVIDEDALRELEEQMTEEEKVAKREEAQNLKAEGNKLFKNEEFADAVYAYSQALRLCPLTHKKDRSIMYANRAACKVKQEHLDSAIEDCTKALELNPLYLKVVLRRAKAYELTDKLDDALKDYQRALELDPGCHEARAACMRLPDQIQERNEKLKEEMMSKLKDLGNLCLRPFGLSTNNFQLNQDPATGSYSVNFQQNPGTNGN